MTVKVGITALGVIIAIPVLIAALMQSMFSVLLGAGSSQPSPTALADIPADYLALYRTAATVCPGLDWSVLAGIGKVETNHGRLNAPGVRSGENQSRAGGPMQFLQSTFDAVTSRHTIPPGGATPPSRYNPHDAIYTAAYYLCDNGARDHRNLSGAIFTYNHADWYVHDVLAQATRYTHAASVGTGNCTTIHAPNAATLAVINYACGQRGLPYVWGGNGAQDGGFDCSGLTTAAYAAAGITLPRTADAQYRTGPHVPTGQPLLPGDLIFYGTPAHIHHVGLYLGNRLMIDAPDFGQIVKIQPYRYPGDDYAGATRPVNGTVVGSYV